MFACAAINRVNLAFRTAIIEDTHLTLAVISFKVEANNPLMFLPLQTYEKKLAGFPFLLVYNSLVEVCSEFPFNEWAIPKFVITALRGTGAVQYTNFLLLKVGSFLKKE